MSPDCLWTPSLLYAFVDRGRINANDDNDVGQYKVIRAALATSADDCHFWDGPSNAILSAVLRGVDCQS